MSQENLLGMDEAALRKLLEATPDLAERRRIRSAIRELQRQELERDEEALASKRFRSERGSHRQDNKENWLRSQQLEEEQQKALASLSQKLESITDVEELTKLLRAASEYEERKLIRAAIRKLRAEEIEGEAPSPYLSQAEPLLPRRCWDVASSLLTAFVCFPPAATLAGNVQSSRRDDAEPPTLPGSVESSHGGDSVQPALARSRESSQRDDAEPPARGRNTESSQRGNTEPLPAAGSVESSRRDDDEPPALAGSMGSSHRGNAEPPAAEDPEPTEVERSGAPEQGNVVEQEHIRAEIQELRSEQQRAPEKPSAQDAASGTLVLLDLHQAPESCPVPGPEPEEHTEELEQGRPCAELAARAELQYQASWKEKSPDNPAATREPGAEQLETPHSMGESCRVEQALPRQPCAVRPGSQFVVCVRSQMLEKTGSPPVEKHAAPAQRGAATPARPDTHRWEPAPSSPRPAGRAELNLGLRSTPIRITTVPSSSSSNVTKMEPELVEQPQAPRLEPELPNGMEKAQVRELEKRSKLSVEELNRIEDEDVLDKMLDQTTDFEERRLIRAAMRELRQRKRDGSSTFVQTKSSYSSSSKKMGSIFDREDESASRQSSLAALERRQAEKKKELMKAQSLPKTSASQARKAMIEKLQKEGGSPANPAVSRTAVQRSSSFGVPNANSIKQMLLDWCRAKTRGYEHVDIQNFSSSWSDGMAFCALVHNFFPEAFDYSQLTPQNRRRNFEVAFSSAEKHADCPQLLDVEDMIRMREPDWKCVYTYIQEFYRCLVQKGLVKTKKS
uniref:Smoothelin n=1 Tax=Dromaius novaehollandiae TaxID=8790 RepID=A0A8C4JH31_DRONO